MNSDIIKNVNKIREQQNKIAYKVLGDFYSYLNSSIDSNYSIFYKNGGSLIDIVTIIPRDDEKTEKKVYSSEAKILSKYSDRIEIDFHLTPRYGEPLENCVPYGFEQYVPAK